MRTDPSRCAAAAAPDPADAVPVGRAARPDPASATLGRGPILFGLSLLGGAIVGVLFSLAVPGSARGADAPPGPVAPVEAVPPAGAVPAGAVPAGAVPADPGAATAVAGAPASPGEVADWARTVARVADSVVSLELSQLRAFDDVERGISTATGFVVDAERGIVLTNRHVVGSGPVRVSATFQNQERVDAVPLYRDPVHDFAFVRYRPEALVHARPDSLPLRPDKVRTGMNIRVIGSDGGEQLSILPGTIARLDREVPAYGRYGYNDFNTFYLQAASGTSGGSSGSPVIDLAGDVVALNAAANRDTASSFFLPLPRVVHALERLRAGEPVARGGLQAIFNRAPFRELARLGLDPLTEARVREAVPGTTGMLQVRQVIPGGAADGTLEAGDALLSAAGRIVTGFVELEALLDERVGERVALEIVRGGEILELAVRAADLHALAPDRLVELGDAVLQEMSIQHARAMNLPASGVVVADPGYFFTRAGVPAGAVVRALGAEPVADLDDFLAALGRVPAPDKATLRFVVPGRERSEVAARLAVDERWFEHRSCTRVDGARFWRCAPIDLDRPPEAGAALDAAFARAARPVPTAFVPSYRDPTLDRVAPALVEVDFHVPYATDNVYARHFTGVGLVLDAERGLVAVDRNTVPVALGDVEITFFGSTVVAGEVVHLHPRHNVALVGYDPAALGGARFEPLALAGPEEAPPAVPLLVGYRDDGTFQIGRTGQLSRTAIDFAPPGLPRFQQAPLDVYGVDGAPPSLGGPLVAVDGTVHGFYTTFAHERDRRIEQSSHAIPAEVLAETLRQYRDAEPYRSLDVHLGYRPLALARELGLPDARLRRYLELEAEDRRVLYVERTVPGTDAATKLAAGDVLLAIDGEPVSGLFEAEAASQRASVALEVLRGGEVLELELFPSAIPANGTDRAVSWAGALFQAPHPDIAWHKGARTAGVYVAGTEAGSPALRDGLWRNRFVTAVDGAPVRDLDDFLGAVGAVPEGRTVRLATVAMDGRRSIVAVEPEYRFWPTFEVRRGADGWRRVGYLN